MKCKLLLSVLIIALSFSSPAHTQVWEFDLIGLYTQFSDDPFISARTVNEHSLTVADSAYNQLKSNTNFRLGAKRYFSDNMDIALEWTRLKSQGTQSLYAEEGKFLIIPTYVRIPPFGGFEQVHDHASMRFDSVNLVLGRHLRTEYLRLRGFSGWQVTQFKTTQHTTGVVNDSGVFPNTQMYTKNSFRGTGPRLGFDIELPLDRHFSFTSQLAGSLLLTERYWRQDAYDSTGCEYHVQTNSGGMVPGAEASAGIAFSLYTDSVEISLRGGYQWAQYFNSSRNTLHESIDFKYHGPYFGVRLVSA